MCSGPIVRPDADGCGCGAGESGDIWQSVPGSCKGRVHVFFLQGADVFDCANLSGVREYVNTLGYTKTYQGLFFHRHKFAQEMWDIRRQDCEARFVVVGYGSGASSAYELCEVCARRGVPVDSLVYLDPVGLTNQGSALGVVGRVVHVKGGSWASSNAPMDGDHNVEFPEAGYFDVPTHSLTVGLLENELGAVASSIPYVTMEQGLLIDDEPTPLEVRPSKPSLGSEWDFLAPQPLVIPSAEFGVGTSVGN